MLSCYSCEKAGYMYCHPDIRWQGSMCLQHSVVRRLSSIERLVVETVSALQYAGVPFMLALAVTVTAYGRDR